MNRAALLRRLLITLPLMLLSACATQTPPNTALASIGQQLGAPAARPAAVPVPPAVRIRRARTIVVAETGGGRIY